MPNKKEKYEMPHGSDNEYMSDDNDDDQIPLKMTMTLRHSQTK